MPPIKRVLLACVLATGLCVAATAQEQDEVTTVDELIAMPLKTPPWWTVSDADTVVHVMALPAWTPGGMEWDDTLIEEKIKGANTVILPRKPLITSDGKPLPARVGFNLWALPAVAMKGWGQVKKLETSPPAVPDALRDRLKALEIDDDDDGDGDGDGDSHMNPTARAIDVWFKTHERAGLVRGEIEDQVQEFAEESEIKVTEIPNYKISSLDWVLAQTRPKDIACLTAALDEAELGPDEVRFAALAWARGRMGPLQELKSSEAACAEAITDRKDFARSTIADEVALIRSALRQKGHSVALIPADHLLGDQGVLKKLEGRNVKIETLQGTT